MKGGECTDSTPSSRKKNADSAVIADSAKNAVIADNTNNCSMTTPTTVRLWITLEGGALSPPSLYRRFVRAVGAQFPAFPALLALSALSAFL